LFLIFRPSTQIRHHLIVIELLSSDDENEDDEDDNEQSTNSKETDESIVTFYQKFSAQLQLNDTTITNHISNQKYVYLRTKTTNILLFFFSIQIQKNSLRAKLFTNE